MGGQHAIAEYQAYTPQFSIQERLYFTNIVMYKSSSPQDAPPQLERLTFRSPNAPSIEGDYRLQTSRTAHCHARFIGRRSPPILSF
jgi:hypothetical protein